jgi:16S rRNA G966 N2-methylase RsmD
MFDLKSHLESQFEDWMDWSNYGSAWELDHIVPQSMFPYKSMGDGNFKLCWSLVNLRPLSSTKNRAEGDRKDTIPFKDFSELMHRISVAIDRPETSELPKAIIDKLSRLHLGEACPMTAVGLSFLDSLFVKRFESKTVGNISLSDAVRDEKSVLRVVTHLVKSGDRVSPASVLSNLKFLVRTPGHFFPGAACAIWSKYAIPGMACFDPFLGWGGRTLGAICSNVSEFVGCDLQRSTIEACCEVAEAFSGVSSTVSKFHCADAVEFLRSTDRMFGMVLTSPPYMDTENYGVESDSMRAGWIDSFVFPLIEQINSHLADGGHVALHLKDVKGAPTLTAYHSAMKAFGFKQVARHKYGRTWTQSVYVYKKF